MSITRRELLTTTVAAGLTAAAGPAFAAIKPAVGEHVMTPEEAKEVVSHLGDLKRAFAHDAFAYRADWQILGSEHMWGEQALELDLKSMKEGHRVAEQTKALSIEYGLD